MSELMGNGMLSVSRGLGLAGRRMLPLRTEVAHVRRMLCDGCRFLLDTSSACCEPVAEAAARGQRRFVRTLPAADPTDDDESGDV